MSELLLEIRTGGYPAGELPEATRQLKAALVAELRDRGLSARQSALGYTARRMMVLLRGLPGTSKENQKERLEVLARAIERAGEQVHWRVRLHWGSGEGPWVRPVTGVLALFERAVVPATVAGVPAGDMTVGHRTLSPRRFRVQDSNDYGRKLATRGIEVRHAERMRILATKVREAAQELGGQVVEDPGLLEVMACSGEIPGVFVGSIDPEMLRLPRQLIVVCLRRRLRAYAVEADGELLPAFIGSMDRPDDPDGRVRMGHELAASSCLEDLRFLYARDQQAPIAALARSAAEQEWLAGRGTYGEKTARLGELCASFCEELGWQSEVDRSREAASLLYADLNCELVQQFPQLRGIVGGLLAKGEGYAESVWRAIYELTSPRKSGAPITRVGRVTALAERLDSLVGIVASRDAKESRGESDDSTSEESSGLPTAGEPHTVAGQVVRLLIRGDLALDLDLLAARAVRAYSSLGLGNSDLLGRVRAVLDEALHTELKGLGFAPDECVAVLSADGGRQLPRIVERLEGLRSLRQEPELGLVTQTAHRLVDILRESPEAELDVGLLVSEAEKDLYILYQKLRRPLEGAVAAGHYSEWLRMMSSLSGGVDRFFREVLVRDEVESLRQNRLALLQAVHRLFAWQVRLAALQPTASVDTVG